MTHADAEMFAGVFGRDYFAHAGAVYHQPVRSKMENEVYRLDDNEVFNRACAAIPEHLELCRDPLADGGGYTFVIGPEGSVVAFGCGSTKLDAVAEAYRNKIKGVMYGAV